MIIPKGCFLQEHTQLNKEIWRKFLWNFNSQNLSVPKFGDVPP
jgi:hypothetical protein